MPLSLNIFMTREQEYREKTYPEHHDMSLMGVQKCRCILETERMPGYFVFPSDMTDSGYVKLGCKYLYPYLKSDNVSSTCLDQIRCCL